ncbi:MAG: antibiotic biosynthesis monooxygenase [Acidimicrobiia bacterium]
MSVVKINAIEVPAGRGDELAGRFAARAGEVEKAEGFEEFQLLRPTDGRTTWLVYTRWRDEESFERWRASTEFARAHAEQAGGHPHGGHPGGPVATASELWSFDVIQRESAR